MELVVVSCVYSLTLAVVLLFHHKEREQNIREKEALLKRIGVILEASVAQTASSPSPPPNREFYTDPEGFEMMDAEVLAQLFAQSPDEEEA